MARYAAGDESAFAELYDGLAPLVIAYLRHRTRDRDLVEDLVQETFLRIHLHRGRYRRDAPVLPWALTIAARLLANRVRGSQRASAVFSAQDEVGDGGVETTSPEQLAMVMELAEQIEHEVLRLPDRDRAAFDLVKRDGLSLRAAAPRLNTTALALKMRLFRVCSRLRRLSQGDLEAGHDERKPR
jgi:RNA polymerase sigma-70 factor (ECF subfamily)